MRLRKQYLTRNDCYRAGRTIRPQGVMVHSTGANNPSVARYVPGDDVIGRNQYGNDWDRPFFSPRPARPTTWVSREKVRSPARKTST